MAEERKTVIHPSGEVIDFETVFEYNPDIASEPERPGHFERVDYFTEVYEDGIKHPKYCNVYLPYGYDPQDKDKRYNVMYYQHIRADHVPGLLHLHGTECHRHQAYRLGKRRSVR